MVFSIFQIIFYLQNLGFDTNKDKMNKELDALGG
jgi:hypothetical protein